MRGRRAFRATLLVALTVAGCIGHGDGTPPVIPTTVVEQPPMLDTAFLGCANVTLEECTAIGQAAVNKVHIDRPGVVVVVEVELFACRDEATTCPPSLSARPGRVTVELDGLEPVWYDVSGDRAEPIVELVTGGCPPLCWELSKAQSAVVSGSGPFRYTLSHCGINHFVDFDNSWWVVVGTVQGESLGGMGGSPGEIRLLGENLAEYREDNTAIGRGTYTATLARFPGPKYIWQSCA